MIESEDNLIKEAFAYYGSAMFKAQELERSLAMSMATIYGPVPSKMNRSQFDSYLSLQFKKTLGQLIHELFESRTDVNQLKKEMKEALKIRNILTHQYFWDRAVPFTSQKGTLSMIKELIEFERKLSLLIKKLDTELKEWRKQHGISDQIIEKEKAKLLKGD